MIQKAQHFLLPPTPSSIPSPEVSWVTREPPLGGTLGLRIKPALTGNFHLPDPRYAVHTRSHTCPQATPVSGYSDSLHFNEAETATWRVSAPEYAWGVYWQYQAWDLLGSQSMTCNTELGLPLSEFPETAHNSHSA